MIAHRQRETADMIQMAMGDDDQIEVLSSDLTEIRSGVTTDHLGVQSAVYKDANIAKLDEQRVSADAARAVQIDEIHLRTGQREAPEENLQA